MLPCQLQMLDLRDNKLKEIPTEITNLNVLERFDISNNEISNLPPALGNVSSLKSLVLDGNPMRSIRRDIISRGTLAVLKHLRNRMETPSETQPATTDLSSSSSGPTSALADGTNQVKYCDKKLLLIPDDVFDSASGPVSSVTFKGNVLEDLPSRIDMFAATLVSLDLSFNRLARVSPLVSCLHKLISKQPPLRSAARIRTLVKSTRSCSSDEPLFKRA
eukprot:m.149304 g.149304  ORF g.149304 m.149304 type:complete len:219 (+) comp24426_c1_seq5:106-762(+)